MNKKPIIRAWKFSACAPEKSPLNTEYTLQAINQFLRGKYRRGCFFGVDNLKTSGLYALHGWYFDFRPYLKLFLVKQYDRWHTVYAPNKTALRESTYGRIDGLIEIPNPENEKTV